MKSKWSRSELEISSKWNRIEPPPPPLPTPDSYPTLVGLVINAYNISISIFAQKPVPAGSHLSARTTYPSTMPALTALIYNYKTNVKTYHKIKATMFNFGTARWGKVRLSQPIVPASQRSGPSVPASEYVFTYVGSFKWRFLGQRQPEPPVDLDFCYKHGAKAPSGWFFTGGNYYSWFQIPETIANIPDPDKLQAKREMEARVQRELQAIARTQQIREMAARYQEAQDENKENMNYKQHRSSTSTTNLPWALKMASDMWRGLDQEHEEMAAKRMKTRGAWQGGLDKEHGRPRRQGAWTTTTHNSWMQHALYARTYIPDQSSLWSQGCKMSIAVHCPWNREWLISYSFKAFIMCILWQRESMWLYILILWIYVVAPSAPRPWPGHATTHND